MATTEEALAWLVVAVGVCCLVVATLGLSDRAWAPAGLRSDILRLMALGCAIGVLGVAAWLTATRRR